MATHGKGTLTNLIKTRSFTSLQALHRRPSSVRDGRDTPEDEEVGTFERFRKDSRDFDDQDEFKRSEERRMSAVLNGPQMRSQRLIGNTNPRYRWERYWKTEEELRNMKKTMYCSPEQKICSEILLTLYRREYYQRTNLLVQQYLYIDRLLDSSLPHDLLNEYNDTPSTGHASSSALRGSVEVPPTISEEPQTPSSEPGGSTPPGNGSGTLPKKVKRTPREIYKISNEVSPLLSLDDDDDWDGPKPEIPGMEDDSVESGDRIVQIAIYVNFAANAILLAGKIAVIVLTSSLSVLASLVDAALDFLSTAIVWITTRMIARRDQYSYPVGRRRLEPIGVLVFSVVMITSFFQVALECLSRLNSMDTSIINLGLPAIIIMASTVVIKALCWLWCRLIKNSSVQALAQDAMTDVVFNLFSIIFPLGTLVSLPMRYVSLIVFQSGIMQNYGGWMPSEVFSSQCS
jgi:hypothetical protein